MKVTAQEFNAEFTNLVRQERGITREVVEMIAFCIKKKFYAELGFSSVMGWLIKNHGYPKNCAYRRIEAAKLVTSVPSAIEKLEAGKVNLSTLATLQSAIRREEDRTSKKIEPKRREELFAMIEDKTEEQTERLVAVEFPEIVKDKVEYVKPISQSETRVNLVFTAEQMAILERVREVTGHSHFNGSWSELVIVMAKEFLKHKDPAQKAERSIKRAETKLSKSAEQVHPEKDSTLVDSVKTWGFPAQKGTGAVPRKIEGTGAVPRKAEGTGAVPRVRAPMNGASRKGAGPVSTLDSGALTASNKGTAPVPPTVTPQLRSFVLFRDGSRCTFVSPITGERCDCRMQLEVDHIIPRALGGTDEPENLRAYCRTHNQLAAELTFGAGFIRERAKHRTTSALLRT